ncbi:MAG TPA: heat-inducible transcriptional repressor HrcA [Microbacteriaceae bacterium]|nr:heat-inducible transcriptional repressor HrcA [Microbacteriaceae bacterium]
MISERSLAVLHAIVSDFVSDGEPVGSKSIVEKHALGVSAATVRNDMAFLEEEQLIVAPHTSSGRVPTDKGYRLYVDTLAKIRPLNTAQRNAIERFLGESQNLDDMMSRTARLLANLTNQVAVIQYPVARAVLVRHVELIRIASDAVLCVLITNNAKVDQQVARLGFSGLDDKSLLDIKERVNSKIVGLETAKAKQQIEGMILNADEWCEETNLVSAKHVLAVLMGQIADSINDKITISGTANLSRVLEPHSSLPSMLQAVEEQVTLLRLIQELVTDQHGVGVSIGRENIEYGLEEASFLASQYEAGSDVAARLGVFGPTRMDYEKNIAAMRAVSRYVGKFLGEVPLS